MDWLPKVPDNSVDMVLADLPYGTTACDWDSVIPLDPLWKQYKRIGKDDTPYVFTATQPFTTKLIKSNMDWFKYEWIWVKNTASNFANAKYRPMRNHEEVLVFGKNKIKYFPIKENRKLSEESKKRFKYDFKTAGGNNKTQGGIGKIDWNPDNKEKCYPKTVQKIESICNNDPDRHHPTQKPIALFEYLIKTYTNEGDVVLDNVMGSGTTALACEKLKRKFYACEKDEEYCEIARERIKRERDQLNLL